MNYSQKYNVKSELIASVINAESGFNSRVVSNKGAIGLMQIMPQTAKFIAEKINEKFDENLLFYEDYNIKFGTYYLAYLFNKFDDKKVVLCAYNAGEGIVSSWLKNKDFSTDGRTLNVIPYLQTKNYVEKIEKCEKIYKNKLSKL